MMERKAPILFLLFSDVLIANGNAGEQPVAYSIFSVSFGCLTVPAILTFEERLHLNVFFPSKVYINLKACTSKLPNKISTLWAVVGFQIRIESLLRNSSTYRGSTEDPGLLLHLEVHEKLKNKYVRIEEGAIMQDYIRAKFDVEQKYVL